MNKIQNRVLLRLQALCLRREYCEKDMLAKALKLLENDYSLANEVIECLKKDKFLDNVRYANAYCRDKMLLSGWGSNKISYYLKLKGIDQDIIKEAISAVDNQESKDRLYRLLANKYKQVRDKDDAKLRLLRFGAQRGYSYDELKSIIDQILSDAK